MVIIVCIGVKFGLFDEATKIIEKTPNQYLLDHVNNAQQTAMHLAVQNNGPELVRRLIEAGADANIPDAEGNTPLDIAIWMGYGQRDMDHLYIAQARQLKDAEKMGREPDFSTLFDSQITH